MLRFVACGGRPAALRFQHRAVAGGLRLQHSEVSRALRRCPLVLGRDAERAALVTSGQVLLPDLRSRRSFSSSLSSQEDGRLVYTGSMGRAVLGVKFFSYSTSVINMTVLPYVLMKTGVGVDSFILKAALVSTVAFLTFFSPVLLHFVTKGYIVRLYHNSDRDLYTAITYNALLSEKRTVFSPADVEVPGISKMFTSFYVKKQSMLVNPDRFEIPHDYNHLMGYDKPFTFDPEDLHKPSKDE